MAKRGEPAGAKKGGRPESLAVRRRRLDRVMTHLGQALPPLEEPAVEKLAEEEQADPFKVLIATLLSARTRDPVTLEASNRLFARAATPAEMANLRAVSYTHLTLTTN